MDGANATNSANSDQPLKHNPELPSHLIDFLDETLAFVDLEVNPRGEIFRAGIIWDEASYYGRSRIDRAVDRLVHIQSVLMRDLCGHNFRRFDYPHLIRAFPQVGPSRIIDTLELAVLAFPLRPHHRLDKDYKLSAFASNDPVQDALGTRKLLHACLAALLQAPTSLLRTYAWLLSCGPTNDDAAYRSLFNTLEMARDTPTEEVEEYTPPDVDDLPTFALRSINEVYLQGFLQVAPSQSFDTRLCVAGLLAWNYAFNRGLAHGREYPALEIAPLWLSHLSPFRDVLERLKPVTTTEPHLEPYLEHFGVESFRPPQDEAIRAILDSKSPLVIIPTGGGKSLCYQLPALMLWQQQYGLTVVISPLQALMDDQVADLEAHGLTFATFINGALPAEERHSRIERIGSGEKALLYISPEQLRSVSMRALLRKRPPALWVVDEAHCISQWGNDFRPDYHYIPKFINDLYSEPDASSPRLALVTATATSAVIEDIRASFARHQLRVGPIIRSQSARRQNLTFQVIAASDQEAGKRGQLVEAVQAARATGAGAVLVYTTTRNSARALAEYLTSVGIPSRHYHGKIAPDTKEEVLNLFKRGELDVVVATSAFGMGINRSDVRGVVHYTMSANLESYVQEAGRAGRDGKPATCTLLYDPSDADLIFSMQARTQLNEAELRSVFIAARAIRQRAGVHADSDAFFLVTTSELEAEGALSTDRTQVGETYEDPESATEHRDTKIKAALHHLETFGLVERQENVSYSVYVQLKYPDIATSWSRFSDYAWAARIPMSRHVQFRALIHALHATNAPTGASEMVTGAGRRYSLEDLSDRVGCEARDILQLIRELEKAGVCSKRAPVVALVTKGVSGDAVQRLRRIIEHDQAFRKLIQEQRSDGAERVQIRIRSAVTMLDPEGTSKLRAADLFAILESWSARRWVRVRRVTKDVVRLSHIALDDHFDQQSLLADAIVSVMYASLGDSRGARLRVEYDLDTFTASVNARLGLLSATSGEVEAALLWLHQRRIIRLTDGLSLFQQAMRLRITTGASARVIAARYPEVRQHYTEQIWRTHVMLAYGRLKGDHDRLQLIDDYFTLPRAEFNQAHPYLAGEESKRPLPSEDFARIMELLSRAQQAIVEADAPAMAVIAGPGSGKTRTIVHRIAYLVKVKRVEPNHILALAYNRNAAREVRQRLQRLIGASAGSIRVHTFHSLALSLLGRAIDSNRTIKAQMEAALREAIQAIEQNTEDEDEDVQVRRLRLLEGVEYIFVDEYQDVREDMYRLVKAIAGLQPSGDETRSVQINLCVIGDDDQGLYEFDGASSAYIRRFEQEFQAHRLMLTENYRSAEPIIEAANRLISHARERAKRAREEQVRVNTVREGDGGPPVAAVMIAGDDQHARLAGWLNTRVQALIAEGTPPGQIAILGREWAPLGPIRLLVDRAGIATQTLGLQEAADLRRQLATCQLIEALRSNPLRVFAADETVEAWAHTILSALNHHDEEPTIRRLLEIAREMDVAREYAAGVRAPTTADVVLESLLEVGEDSLVFVDSDAVVFGSCHSAKGLEFDAVFLLTDAFDIAPDAVEAERRVFYVAMTRARRLLTLCQTEPCQFVQESGVEPSTETAPITGLPNKLVYLDFGLRDVFLEYSESQREQEVICALKEGAPLLLDASHDGARWIIKTPDGKRIGALSRKACAALAEKGIKIGAFSFHPGEVRVGQIVRWVKSDELTGAILGEWFLPLPQIRICR